MRVLVQQPAAKGNHSQQAQPGRPRHRYIKSISLGLNDALFSVSRYPWLLFDYCIVFLMFQIGIWVSPWGHWGQLYPPHLTIDAIYATVFCCTSLGLGFYDRARRFDLATIARAGTIGTLSATLVSLAVYYFVIYDVFGRLNLLYATTSAFVSTFFFRTLAAFLLRRNPYRFTIIGKSAHMDEVIEFCAENRRAARFYVHTPWSEIFSSPEEPTVEGLLAHRIGDIVLTTSTLNDPDVLDFAINSLHAKCRVVDELAFYAQVFERLPIDDISKTWVLQQGIARRQVFTLFAKRLLDVVMALVALLVFAPLLLAIAVLIKITSPGPIFFNQERQGRYSQPFIMYKFRTMKVENDGNAKASFTRPGDTRVTWIGRFLRPTHLDELPQLLNILKGDMSVVGPRPEALRFAWNMREQIPLYELRYLVRPGLTGHAQLNQGYAMDNVADTKVKLSFDLYYLCNHSIWMDIQLILRTIFFLTRKAR